MPSGTGILFEIKTSFVQSPTITVKKTKTNFYHTGWAWTSRIYFINLHFWFGEIGIAAILTGVFAVPFGIFIAGRAEITLAFIGAAVLFLPLFVFPPKIIPRAMKADADNVIDAFGKNEQVKKVFWALFAAMAGLVLAQVVDPVTGQKVVRGITGRGV